MKAISQPADHSQKPASSALGQTPSRAATIPKPMLRVYEAIVSLTDAVCDEHLDSEYKALSQAMAAALCRKRPSPLGLGQPRSWACGIVYVLGRVNFLGDPSFSPHMTTTAIMRSVLDSDGARIFDHELTAEMRRSRSLSAESLPNADEAGQQLSISRHTRFFMMTYPSA